MSAQTAAQSSQDIQNLSPEERSRQEQQNKAKCEAEADQLIKYLEANGLRQKKVVFGQNGRPEDKTFSKQYVTGDELHFSIISQREDILKICQTMNSLANLNGLQKISDSIKLCQICTQLGRIVRVMPHKMVYPDPNSKDARTPKQVQMCPQQQVGPTGFYMFESLESAGWKQILTLFAVVFLAFFFLLFKVWPEWLRVGVYYVSWYLLVALIGTAIVRAIVWFVFFHFGLDIWIFPNYFIDSDNILDSFRPLQEMGIREDWRDPQMVIMRLLSAAALVYGAQEFLREPRNLDDLLDGSTEVWNELFEWGQNKFLGIPDNSTQVQLKKSARQIYSEAFMEDETMFGMGAQRQFDETDYSVDPKEALREAALAEELAEEERRAQNAEESEQVDLDSQQENKGEQNLDLLDQLTGDMDDEDEDDSDSSNQKQADL